MTGARLDYPSMVRRVAGELKADQVVALGPGIPELLASETPAGSGIWFVSESGAVVYHSSRDRLTESQNSASVVLPGSSFFGVVDVAGMLRGGWVGLAVLQPSQVSARGDMVHWTSVLTPGMFAPGPAVDLAFGAGSVVAIMRHTRPDGSPNIVEAIRLPVDGPQCVTRIVTDIAVLSAGQEGLELLEVAPGWTSDEVAALTGASLTVSDGLVEMTFKVPSLTRKDKVYPTAVEALWDVPDGSIVNVDGFAGPGGMAHYLLTGLRDQGASRLTMISNTAGIARVVNFGTPEGLTPIDHSILVENGQIAKSIASYPVSPSISRPSAFEDAYKRGEATLEVVPQGTLAERLRCGGAGVAAFYTPTASGTLLAEGKETRVFDGKEYVLELGIKADYCIIRGYKADTLGNVIYKGTSRNFNPVMATAANVTIVEVDEIVEPGDLDSEEIVTPGIFVDRIVKRPDDFSGYL